MFFCLKLLFCYYVFELLFCLIDDAKVGRFSMHNPVFRKSVRFP